ncbi:elongation factor P 5-aminopentanone reductase [Macrococcoides caseolyticum]|uniref:elongation factor P 5-aminopentanone reductase n=1 Tax=Macrococcoides caseolyticum TaxID=69966 RepID=UPI001F450506|nr:SDR family oxidoreductase [Macrococcus caseolyticus]MCE4957228.1 SDR family oxidoreductase [Macrococcus caseolyticus]
MGKYIVIGASGDIGKQIVLDLLENNHEVIAHFYSSHREQLQTFFKDKPVTLVQFDLSQPLIHSPFEDWMVSHLDGLIYAAGTAHFSAVQDITTDAMDTQFQIHFANLVKLTQFTLSGLLQGASGRIVVISSIWGETGSAMESLYSGMKAAQIGYIKSIAKELALTGVTANVIAPGIVNGKMTLQLDAQDVTSVLAEVPQQRLIEPKEVSHVVRYLLGDLAQSITGTVHRINGGWYI